MCRTKDSKIAYTTDGNNPIEKDAVDSETTSVTVMPGQTLKVQAFADKRRASDVVVASYGLAKSTAPPEPTPTTTQATTGPTTTRATTRPTTTRAAGGS